MDLLTNIKYNLAHKKAFLKVEKELLCHNTLRGYLHDLDKLFLYFILPKEKVSKLHRRYSKHHNPVSRRDFVEMVIDWECSRITKPTKQRNAVQTLYELHAEYKEDVLPILKQLGLSEKF